MCLLEGERMTISGSCMNSTMFYRLLTVQSDHRFMNSGVVTIMHFPINRNAQMARLMAVVSLSTL
jgi:hypothetical protein